LIQIKTRQEIAVMAEGGNILKDILGKLAEAVKPGLTTEEIDQLARELVLSWADKVPEAKISSSFWGYRGFPGFVCISVNDEVVHGIPSSSRVLEEGDIVGLDFGLIYRGFHTDAAITVPVGKISKEAQKLLQTTKESLELGIEEVLIGNTVGDIGYVIQKYVEKKGFGVVKELVGHGVGRKLHEEPYVPNYGRKGEGEVLKEGMVIAIEPMITAGKPAVDIASDNWTYKTKDHSLAAHFEHTVAVTKEGPKVLT